MSEDLGIWEIFNKDGDPDTRVLEIFHYLANTKEIGTIPYPKQMLHKIYDFTVHDLVHGEKGKLNYVYSYPERCVLKLRLLNALLSQNTDTSFLKTYYLNNFLWFLSLVCDVQDDHIEQNIEFVIQFAQLLLMRIKILSPQITDPEIDNPAIECMKTGDTKTDEYTAICQSVLNCILTFLRKRMMSIVEKENILALSYEILDCILALISKANNTDNVKSLEKSCLFWIVNSMSTGQCTKETTKKGTKILSIYAPDYTFPSQTTELYAAVYFGTVADINEIMLTGSYKPKNDDEKYLLYYALRSQCYDRKTLKDDTSIAAYLRGLAVSRFTEKQVEDFIGSNFFSYKLSWKDSQTVLSYFRKWATVVEYFCSPPGTIPSESIIDTTESSKAFVLQTFLGISQNRLAYIPIGVLFGIKKEGISVVTAEDIFEQFNENYYGNYFVYDTIVKLYELGQNHVNKSAKLCNLIVDREDLVQLIPQIVLDAIFSDKQLNRPYMETIFNDFDKTCKLFNACKGTWSTIDRQDSAIDFLKQIVTSSKQNLYVDGGFSPQFWEICYYLLPDKAVDLEEIAPSSISPEECEYQIRNLIAEFDCRAKCLGFLPQGFSQQVEERMNEIRDDFSDIVLRELHELINQKRDSSITLLIDQVLSIRGKYFQDTFVELLNNFVTLFNTQASEILQTSREQTRLVINVKQQLEKEARRILPDTVKSLDIGIFANVKKSFFSFSTPEYSYFNSLYGIVDKVIKTGTDTVGSLSGAPAPIIAGISICLMASMVVYNQLHCVEKDIKERLFQPRQCGEYPPIVTNLVNTILEQFTRTGIKCLFSGMKSESKIAIDELLHCYLENYKVLRCQLFYAKQLVRPLDSSEISMNVKKLFVCGLMQKWPDVLPFDISCDTYYQELKSAHSQVISIMETKPRVKDTISLLDAWKEGNTGFGSVVKFVAEVSMDTFTGYFSLQQLCYLPTLDNRDKGVMDDFLLTSEFSNGVFQKYSKGDSVRFGDFSADVLEFECSVSKRPQYGIFRVQNSDVIVLAFKGSSSVAEVITDILAFPTEDVIKEFGDHKLHFGFVNAVKNCFNNICNVLLENVTDGKRVLITGHSLGGAFAHLFYLWLQASSSAGGPLVNHSVYTFGAPLVIHGSCNYFSPNVHCCVNNFDIVPRLLGNKSLGTILGLVEGMETTSMIHMAAEKLQVLQEYQPFGNYYWLANSKIVKVSSQDVHRLLSCNVIDAMKGTLLSDHHLGNYIFQLKNL